MDLSQPLDLPCGAQLPNRLVKAAMSEQLARPGGRPGRGLQRLYKRWGRGGAGLLISGNVMVDPTHLESHNNVILTGQSDVEPFRRWAQTGGDVPLWLQLNHPGRQCPRHINPHPMAPSAIASVALFRSIRAFGPPRAMTEVDIHRVIDQFAVSAAKAREAGFDGVQLHGAHGYLISQFLSPRTNTRQDDWGGTLTGRARLLRSVVRAMRQQVGDDFPIGVKLNSADFQRGGFDEEDSAQVLQMLEEDGVDMIEISGGNYESKAMFDLDEAQTTPGDREAYFLRYARRVRTQTQVPLMVTGGFRSRSVMTEALRSDALDLIGMARPFANNPDIAHELLHGKLTRARPPVRIPGLHRISVASEAMLSVVQMGLMARGIDPNGPLGPLLTALLGMVSALTTRR